MASEYVPEREKEVSRSLHLDVNATDSQVLGSLDSVSLPSEPPDIRNWFPSYEYESPELNTLDGFPDFDGSGETCLEEEKEGKPGENLSVGEFGDGLLAAAKESQDGVVKCNESNEFKRSKSAALVSRLSESVSFCSEPPDIKNWFSSYLYESPLLDTHEFTISDHKEREDGESCDAQGSCTQDNKVVKGFIDVEDGAELPSRSKISDIVVKSTNLVKDTKLDHQAECKEDHDVDLKPVPAILNQATSKMEMPDCDATLDCSLINRTSPKMFDMKNDTSSQDRKCVHTSIGMKDCIKVSLQKDGFHGILSPAALDLTVRKADPWKRPADRRSTGKENKGTDLENGFISTRKKSSQANTGIVTRCTNGGKPKFNSEKDAGISRKVLSDTSNFHSANVVESSGKWSCPRKSKPNPGPPLKQLRLERWVQRV